MTHFEILEYLKHLETISYPTSRQSLRLFPWKFWQILVLKGLCVTGFHLNIKGSVKSLLHFLAVGDDVIAFSMHLLSAYYMPLSWNTSFIQQIFIGNCVPCEELWTVKRIDGTIPVLEELTLLYQRAKTGIQIVQTQSSKSRYTGDVVRVQSARNHSVWQGWVVVGGRVWRRENFMEAAGCELGIEGLYYFHGHDQQRAFQAEETASHTC